VNDEHQSVRITWRIGLESPSFDFEEPVIKEACRLGGGCSVTREIGYWIEGSDVPQFRYSGPVDREFCLTLIMTVPEHTASRVMECMQSAIAQEARAKGISTDWVHVEWERVTTRHFSIKKVRP